MDGDRPAKERILAYARERFLHDGLQAVSMDDLAAGLGISKKTLYKFFPSKDDLLRQTAERMMAEARAVLHRITAGDGTFIEKIDAFSVAVGTQLARASRELARDLRRYAPDLWGRIEAFREERIRTNFTLLFRQGVREGLVRPEVSERIFLLAYLAAVNTIINPAVLAEEPFSFREGLHGIISIFFRGILTPEGIRQMSDLEQSRPSPHP